LDQAYKNFFKRGNKGFPQFKSKFAKQTFTISQINNHIKIDFSKNKITIPKIGKVFSPLNRKFNGEIKLITISKTKTNKYYCSVCFESNEVIQSKPNIVSNIIGIDLGIKDFATMSDGSKIKNHKFYHRALSRLCQLQRKLSNKIKRSNNYNKMKLRIAKLHEYITNCRNDLYHKESSRIINENQVIIIEDLNVNSLLKKSTKIMSRHISDASWSTFTQMLTYKAEWYGKHLFRVNPAYSSKSCNDCGVINDNLKLSDRSWQCLHCQKEHDRDINAAKNILSFGQGLPEFKALNCSIAA
jgi:putative transposase